MQAESLVTEVVGQMLQEMSSTEIKLEQERVAEEKRKLEEARLVHWKIILHLDPKHRIQNNLHFKYISYKKQSSIYKMY